MRWRRPRTLWLASEGGCDRCDIHPFDRYGYIGEMPVFTRASTFCTRLRCWWAPGLPTHEWQSSVGAPLDYSTATADQRGTLDESHGSTLFVYVAVSSRGPPAGDCPPSERRNTKGQWGPTRKASYDRSFLSNFACQNPRKCFSAPASLISFTSLGVREKVIARK